MPELRRAKRGEGTSVASDDRVRHGGTLRNPEGFAEGACGFPASRRACMDFHASDMTNEGDTSEARDRAVAERRRVCGVQS
jgi:hypothetical protein